jgi:5-methylcytosine-specific restriction protein A
VVVANSVRVGELEFIIGEDYVRRDIHHAIGGQRQGGISTPHGYPVVLIFTGESGKQHGYGFDGWKSKTEFHYTGEGQPSGGDMVFKRGNLAIRDHLENNERLLLFEQVRSTNNARRVRFVAEMRYRRHRIESRDSEGTPRDVIVFELEPVDA